MKAFFNKRFVMFFIAGIVLITITACSGDDDKNKKEYSIIGSWKCDFSGGYCIYTFNENGRGQIYEKEYVEDREYIDIDKFSYYYNSSLNQITIRFDDEDETVIYEVISIEENRMILDDEEEGYGTFLRYTGTVPTEIIDPTNKPDDSNDSENSPKFDIVGVWKADYYWKYSGVTQTITLDIKNDGTLSILSTDDIGQEPYVGSGSWTYDTTHHIWELTTGHSLVSGDYQMIGKQLICYQYFNDGSSRTIYYNRQ